MMRRQRSEFMLVYDPIRDRLMACRRFAKMDGLDDPESNAKVSDSAYSNSCSNSHSRRSHSSKSTHSSSHSSGSSGYGGKPNTSGNSNKPAEKRSKDKDGKKKAKSGHMETQIESMCETGTETRPQEMEEKSDVELPEVKENETIAAPAPQPPAAQASADAMDVDAANVGSHANEEEAGSSGTTANPGPQLFGPEELNDAKNKGSFSCAVSLRDGVVICASADITCTLGFPKDMWLGRPFIDIVHPKDRDTFSTQIMKGLLAPNGVTCAGEKMCEGFTHTLSCRMRKYRGLSTGFGVKCATPGFLPFSLTFVVKEDTENDGKPGYLKVNATVIDSAYKSPHEMISSPEAFTTRHVPSGKLQHIDRRSVPYLGYMPQDLSDKDVMLLYHPEDMGHLYKVYELLVQKGIATRSQAYRMLAHNGNYVKLESEFSSFVNPWSNKLEFVTGTHYVLEGPSDPDVFQMPSGKPHKVSEDLRVRAQIYRDRIVRILTENNAKALTAAKYPKRHGSEMASYFDSFIDDPTSSIDELHVDIQDQDYERDSVMLGGISPHHDNDSGSRAGTPLSYNMLNYNETLEKYFESYVPPGSDINDASEEARDSDPAESSGGNKECDSASTTGSQWSRHLTESLLLKHNSMMEKELLKRHREHRPSSVSRDEQLRDERRNKKEHFARCNAPHKPTEADSTADVMTPHGTKRPSLPSELDQSSRKQHCTWTERSRRADASAAATANAAACVPITAAVATAHWPTPGVSAAHALSRAPTLVRDVTLQAPIVNPVAGVPAVAVAASTLWPRPALNALYALPRAHPHARAATQQPQLANHMAHQMANHMAQQITNLTHPMVNQLAHPMASLAHPMANHIAHPMANHIANPMANHIAHSMANHVGHPMTLPLAHPMANHMVDPITISMANQMAAMPAGAVHGMIPMYYVQPPRHTMPISSYHSGTPMSTCDQASVPYLMYGEPMFGSPFVYDPLGHVASSPAHALAPAPAVAPAPAPAPALWPTTAAAVAAANRHNIQSLPLTLSNYEEVCNSRALSPSKNWGAKRHLEPQSTAYPKAEPASLQPGKLRVQSRANVGTGVSGQGTCNERRSINDFDDSGDLGSDPTYAASATRPSESPYRVPEVIKDFRAAKAPSEKHDDSFPERTDGDSSSASFSSSFFKTESGSNEESDSKNKDSDKAWSGKGGVRGSKLHGDRKPAKRKDAPWNEQVCVTSDLIYRYKVESKPLEEVLEADRLKLATQKQPELVSEQLSQLYLELQLNGQAPRLNIEEGITSSSSSGEECQEQGQKRNPTKGSRRKEYSRMVMIYEEDAPLPPPIPPFAPREPRPSSENKNAPSDVTPVTGWFETKPVAGPSFTKPVTGPSCTGPVASTSLIFPIPGPVAGPSCARPVPAPSCARPVPGPSCAIPVGGPSCARPIAGPSCARPVAGPSCARPVPGPSCAIPVAGPSCAIPVVGPSVIPVAGPSCAE